GDVAAVARANLCGADVEAAVDLPRVGGDDLGRNAIAPQGSGNLQRQARLPGRGRPCDDEERRRAHAVALPRTAYRPAWSVRTAANGPTQLARPPRWARLLLRGRPETGIERSPKTRAAGVI